MAGISTGPSFAHRMAGATNALAQSMGGPLGEAAKGTSAFLKRRPQFGVPQMPKAQSGIPAGQMPGQQMPMPMTPALPIDTGPSNAMGGGYGGGSNPGIFSGLFNRPTGYERPPMAAGPTDIGGLFGRYNQMGQFPNRRY